MPKFNTLEEYIDTFNEQAREYYRQLRDIVFSVQLDVKERLFAGQVAFYVEENLKDTFHSSPVIVMSFCKDHVNVFAGANIPYMKQLPEYKFTSKGTLQLQYSAPLNVSILQKLFESSLV